MLRSSSLYQGTIEPCTIRLNCTTWTWCLQRCLLYFAHNVCLRRVMVLPWHEWWDNWGCRFLQILPYPIIFPASPLLTIMKMSIPSTPTASVSSVNISLPPPPTPCRNHALRTDDDVPMFFPVSQSILGLQCHGNESEAKDQPIPSSGIENNYEMWNKRMKPKQEPKIDILPECIQTLPFLLPGMPLEESSVYHRSRTLLPRKSSLHQLQGHIRAGETWKRDQNGQEKPNAT